MSKWDQLKEQIVESPVWRSMFRHGYEDNPRNRILAVSGNVWLHLHPATKAQLEPGLLGTGHDVLVVQQPGMTTIT